MQGCKLRFLLVIYLLACSVCQSVCLSVYLTGSLSVGVCLSQHSHPFICLSSIHPSILLPVYDDILRHSQFQTNINLGSDQTNLDNVYCFFAQNILMIITLINWHNTLRNEQHHEKTCLCYMRTTKAQISLHIRAVWISAIVVLCLCSIISLVSISEISSLYPASMAAQAGLCLTWSQFLRTGFLVARLKWCYYTVCKQHEPQHDKTNNVACVPSKDSDQPGHLPSLIRVFAVRMKKA